MLFLLKILWRRWFWGECLSSRFTKYLPILNPAKNELCKISKTILDKINVNLHNSQHLNQWKNTPEVTDWFKGIDNKQHYKFIMFDIKDFYLSISKELLTDVLTFAKTIITLDDHDKIIYHSCKSINFQLTTNVAEKRKWPVWCFNGCLKWHRGVETYRYIFIEFVRTAIWYKKHWLL